MALEVLSKVCAKLEPVNSTKQKILKINVLQKFTLYHRMFQFKAAEGTSQISTCQRPLWMFLQRMEQMS